MREVRRGLAAGEGVAMARSKTAAVAARLCNIVMYLQKRRVVKASEAAKDLGLSHEQLYYAVKLLDGSVCYKVVGKYAFLAVTCEELERHLNKFYEEAVSTAKKMVDGCKSAVCCAKLIDLVAELTRRDPPRPTDLAFYGDLLSRGGDLVVERTPRGSSDVRVRVCVKRR